MGQNGRHQDQNPPDLGYCGARDQDLLYQVLTKSGSGSNSAAGWRCKSECTFKSRHFLVHSLILFSQHGDPLDISLAMVPPNHTLIPQRNLEAEASGLLDRMLGVLHENPT